MTRSALYLHDKRADKSYDKYFHSSDSEGVTKKLYICSDIVNAKDPRHDITNNPVDLAARQAPETIR